MLNTNLVSQETNGLPTALRTSHAIVRFYPFTRSDLGKVTLSIPEEVNQVQLSLCTGSRLSGEPLQPPLFQYTFHTTQGISSPLADTVPHLVNRLIKPSDLFSPTNAHYVYYGQNNFPGLGGNFRTHGTDAGSHRDDQVSVRSSTDNLFDDLYPQNSSQATSTPLVASIFTPDSEDENDRPYVSPNTPEIVSDKLPGSGTSLPCVNPQDLHTPHYPPLTSNHLSLIFPPNFNNRNVMTGNGVMLLMY
jgi:hypothetical protein